VGAHQHFTPGTPATNDATTARTLIDESPAAFVTTTTRRSSANAPQREGGQQRHGRGERRDQGRAGSPMTPARLRRPQRDGKWR